jgi:hypothetical protein
MEASRVPELRLWAGVGPPPPFRWLMVCGGCGQVKRRLPKVNKEMAARLLLDQDAAAPAGGSSEEDAPEKPPAQKKHKGLPSLLQDDRFAALFKDKVRSTTRPSGAAHLGLCTPALARSSMQRPAESLLFPPSYWPIATVCVDQLSTVSLLSHMSHLKDSLQGSIPLAT